MHFIKTKMFTESGQRVQLLDILKNIEGHNYVWTLLDFRGIGKAPRGWSMTDLEKEIKSRFPTGLELNWQELLEFTKGLDQTMDCLLLASREEKSFRKDKFV